MNIVNIKTKLESILPKTKESYYNSKKSSNSTVSRESFSEKYRENSWFFEFNPKFIPFYHNGKTDLYKNAFPKFRYHNSDKIKKYRTILFKGKGPDIIIYVKSNT